MTPTSPDSAVVRDRAIVITRTFDAPRDLVFRMFTDPAHVGHWWGPDGFTITTETMHVAPGGEWRFMMHGPDGTDFPNKVHYLEVDPPARLLYDHGAFDGPAHFRVTITFEEDAGRTTVTMHSLFPTEAALQGVMRFGAVEGGRQTLARLDAHLRTL